MTPNVAQLKTKSCPGCRFTAQTGGNFCPRCGKPLQDEQQIRILGALLAFLGLFISTVMGFVMIRTQNAIANSDRYGATVKWNADADETQWVFAVLGLVLAFGVSAIVAGSAMFATGKRNLLLIKIMFGLFFAIWLIGSAATIIF